MMFKNRKPKVERSPQWANLRKQWLAVNPTCAACDGKKKLEVHHIVPVHIDPSKELDSDNLITLCEQGSHNDHFLFGHLLDWKSMNPSCIVDSQRIRGEIRARVYG